MEYTYESGNTICLNLSKKQPQQTTDVTGIPNSSSQNALTCNITKKELLFTNISKNSFTLSNTTQ